MRSMLIQTPSYGEFLQLNPLSVMGQFQTPQALEKSRFTPRFHTCKFRTLCFDSAYGEFWKQGFARCPSLVSIEPLSLSQLCFPSSRHMAYAVEPS